MHFCGDSLTEYSIYASSTEEMDCCSQHEGCSEHEAKKMSCCENKSIYLYSDVNTTLDTYKLISSAPLVQIQEVASTISLVQEQPVYFNSNAPPTYQGRSIYELNSSFTFYG